VRLIGPLLWQHFVKASASLNNGTRLEGTTLVEEVAVGALVAAAHDDDPPHLFWSALSAGAALLAPGALALATGLPVLFASLGPSAVTMAHYPRRRSSRIYSVIVSHIIGVVAGFAAVRIFGLQTAPSIFEAQRVSMARVFAAVVALSLAVAGEVALRAMHPPAGSTTLLVALGSFRPTWHDAGAIVLGVLAVAGAGWLVRVIRLRPSHRHASSSG